MAGPLTSSSRDGTWQNHSLLVTRGMPSSPHLLYAIALPTSPPLVPRGRYAHELTDCSKGVAFAYGGLNPGTLHAKGALVKTHQVSYSVGAAGTYLLHVGLRQKEAILPGSPFVLTVKPGLAFAPCTELPTEQVRPPPRSPYSILRRPSLTFEALPCR